MGLVRIRRSPNFSATSTNNDLQNFEKVFMHIQSRWLLRMLLCYCFESGDCIRAHHMS